jgi:hypothetical protein
MDDGGWPLVSSGGRFRYQVSGMFDVSMCQCVDVDVRSNIATSNNITTSPHHDIATYLIPET